MENHAGRGVMKSIFLFRSVAYSSVTLVCGMALLACSTADSVGDGTAEQGSVAASTTQTGQSDVQASDAQPSDAQESTLPIDSVSDGTEVSSAPDDTGPTPPVDTAAGTELDILTEIDTDAPTLDSEESPDVCEPTCAGVDCGDDGCGGVCGFCPADLPVCTDGVCTDGSCIPDCIQRSLDGCIRRSDGTIGTTSRISTVDKHQPCNGARQTFQITSY